MKKIAILGGTFDPIHNQHIKIANAAYKSLNLDEVWILPTKHNPLKQNVSATNEQRINMIKLAIKKFSWLKLNEYEINNQDEITYTINTLRYFIKNNKDTKFFFLIGADNLYTLEKWKSINEIVNLVQLVVVNRPHFYRTIKLMKKYAAINLIVKPSSKVSSSIIRSGVDIFELNEEVNDYINSNLIYYKERLNQHLDQKRVEHSINVGKMAQQLAKKYGVNEKQALVAGTYHDIAKRWPVDQQKTFLLNYYPEGLKAPNNLYHAYCGAIYLEKHWYVKDKEIISAIFKHTSGAVEMSKLDLIILLADKISVERDFDFVVQLREISFINLQKAFVYYLEILKSSLIKRNYEITEEFNLIYETWKNKK